MKDTFTLWGVQSAKTHKILGVHKTRIQARHDADYWKPAVAVEVVKLECHIIQPQRKPKRGKYPNDNFGLPAGYKPHTPDNLTREQVGEGFRLLADVEIWKRSRYSGLDMNIAVWTTVDWEEGNYGWHTTSTYRVPINTPLDINPKLKTK